MTHRMTHQLHPRGEQFYLSTAVDLTDEARERGFDMEQRLGGSPPGAPPRGRLWLALAGSPAYPNSWTSGSWRTGM